VQGFGLTMDSAVLGLSPSDCDCCAAVVGFEDGFPLEDAIGFHAFSPPLFKRVPNGIPLG
jgi:hypothetical protein